MSCYLSFENVSGAVQRRDCVCFPVSLAAELRDQSKHEGKGTNLSVAVDLLCRALHLGTVILGFLVCLQDSRYRLNCLSPCGFGVGFR